MLTLFIIKFILKEIDQKLSKIGGRIMLMFDLSRYKNGDLIV